MRRIFLSLLLSGLFISGGAIAQSTDGGLPWTVTEQRIGNIIHDIPVTVLSTPDYAKAMEEDKIPTRGAYRFGLDVDANVDLKNSGKVIYLEDGRKVWTAKVRVDGALGITFIYDRFHLPKGVNLFLKNENGKQILGALNERYNPDDGVYATPLIQGTTTTIEINLEKGVELSDIDFRINKVVAAYRGGFAEDLGLDYGDEDGAVINAENRPLDNADPCHVNAICFPEGTTYEKIRRTAAQVTMNGYVCSGNLINNTAMDCKPYFLMASHCEQSNSFSSAPYNAWLFYFNDEYPGCTVNNVSRSSLRTDYITGARFKARSSYNSGTSAMIGDFLLLELKDQQNKLGNNFNAYLAGWDISQFPTPGKYIGFHHPAGDPKKLTVFKKIRGDGTFNQNTVPNTHWTLSNYEKGGIEGGSSGSGVFSMNTQKLIGDLSGGPDFGSPCDNPNNSAVQNYSLYSKINLNWLYESAGDGTSATRLKDWLDPTNTGQTTTPTMKLAGSNEVCGDDVGIDELKVELENATHIYPNPSSGVVFLQVNLANTKDLNVEVYNMLGVLIDVYSVKGVLAGDVKIDLTKHPSGIYLLKIRTDKTTISKKVVLR